MMPMRNQQGMMGKKGPRKANPEMQKMRKKMQATQAIAEAHKELARIYEEQKKIDEAAAELKKILDLFKGIDTEMKEATDEEGRGFPLTRKVMPVYHEIARLYLKNNRLDDAEKIMLEGIAQFENDDPQAASKLILELGEIYRQNNKLDKAETLLKKVIEINKKALEE
jgi:tetratricopeptide (TPR) repeat protein